MKFVIATLAFALGLAAAVQEDPKCFCNKMYLPICGSDGVTYDNYCMLKCQQKNNPDLTAVYYGRCEEQNLVAEPMCICNKMYLPVCGSDGVTYSNPCLLKCQQKKNPELTMEQYGVCVNKVEAKYAPVCPLIWAPVCGSDGKTYASMCNFNYQQTQVNGLTLAHHGTCEDVQTEAKYAPVCPLIWAPVCGSDGKTYPSMCYFNYQQTQVNGLTLAHHGACGEVQANEMPVCACPFNYDPICGTDGKTYGNMCGLKCQQKANSELQVAYKGECKKAEPMCICNRMYLPVCGSDGVTYSNPCVLRCQQKKNPELTMVRYGICVNKVEAKYAPVCPLIWAPVCGSDGKTYANMCNFNYQQTQVNGLTLAHHGACEDVQTEAKEVTCPAACPAIWAPVCGSDGKTYASMCNFNCKQTQVDGLTLVHHGACEQVQANEMPVCACPFNYAPICGTDGKTYGNMCGLKCQQKANSELQVAYKGECKAVCICTREYNPVCGSDGHTYGNPCTFRCQQKSVNGLTVAHYGECH